jgi:hypothetical protein
MGDPPRPRAARRNAHFEREVPEGFGGAGFGLAEPRFPRVSNYLPGMQISPPTWIMLVCAVIGVILVAWELWR